jgi:hypothetical protein
LDWLQTAAPLEITEQTEAGTPEALRDLVARAAAILRTMVSEEAAAIRGENSSKAPMAMFAAPLKTAPVRTLNVHKMGSRNGEAELAIIQQLHDSSVELGAVCETQKMARGTLEKRFDVLAETLADVLRRVKNIEEQPLPLPFLGHPRAISRRSAIYSVNQALTRGGSSATAGGLRRYARDLVQKRRSDSF